MSRIWCKKDLTISFVLTCLGLKYTHTISICRRTLDDTVNALVSVGSNINTTMFVSLMQFQSILIWMLSIYVCPSQCCARSLSIISQPELYQSTNPSFYTLALLSHYFIPQTIRPANKKDNSTYVCMYERKCTAVSEHFSYLYNLSNMLIYWFYKHKKLW